MPVFPRSIRRVALSLASLLVVPSVAAAQLGVGVQVTSPDGRFRDAQRNGLGAYLKAELGLVLVGVAAEAKVTRFTARDGGSARTVAGVQAGPRLSMGLLRVGLDAGYFTEFDRSGWVPNVGLRLGPIEAGLTYTMVGRSRWWALRAGLRR